MKLFIQWSRAAPRIDQVDSVNPSQFLYCTRYEMTDRTEKNEEEVGRDEVAEALVDLFSNVSLMVKGELEVQEISPSNLSIYLSLSQVELVGFSGAREL